jgi:hypothetical protein
MDNIMKLADGKHTVETFARERGIARQSALNLLSRLKLQGYVQTSGGGRQPRIYTLSSVAQVPTNGFYDMVNRYSPEKLVPRFRHRVRGRYTIEHAIVDGVRIGDVRTLEATMHLFRHVTSWKRLFRLAKERNLVKQVHELYHKARTKTRCKKLPKRYA